MNGPSQCASICLGSVRVVRQYGVKVVVVLAVCLGLAGTAGAAAVDVGNWFIPPNTNSFPIRFYVTGADAVQGLNFNIQIADGGPEVGGVLPGPTMIDVDLLTGTIFDGNNTGQVDSLSERQIWVQTTTTAGGTVSADGLLATVLIDMPGFDTGLIWDFSLSGTLNGDTDFAGVPIDIVNGLIISSWRLGDRDGDGFVGQGDLDTVLGSWGQPVPASTPPDPSGDGFVGQDDLDVVLGEWGFGTPPSSSVPEPATMSLLMLAGAAVLRRTRK